MNTPHVSYICGNSSGVKTYTDTALFLLKKTPCIITPHHNANVIIPVAEQETQENAITWQEKDGIVVWQTLLGWLHVCVLCAPRGETRALFLFQKHDPLSPHTFEPGAKVLNGSDLSGLWWPPLASNLPAVHPSSPAHCPVTPVCAGNRSSTPRGEEVTPPPTGQGRSNVRGSPPEGQKTSEKCKTKKKKMDRGVWGLEDKRK